ncbi:TonB-dependent copper receptor [Pelagicoccus sp. SDUM812005]|uniref:TonB-dependent copper receptor n=1 Tax=Pelagicoccus sp. SDUM812005 TaxID=3041257 RepID=UPI00281010CC|nr:TonB-dependent copper receptor [Pelagicoccus sp. SDUM812005]MDQ8182278.1 TonB-dependent copper receptor [Pelagicoccus sp. SDUM812005]
MKHFPITAATLAASITYLNAATAQNASTTKTVDLDPLVVTTTEALNTYTTRFDPTVAIQPLPANDGADALRHVAGINVSRKGGANGDPTFRGMAGSRLNVVVDGVSTLGGCGNRMDPPTAYVFPSSFDQVTILKGPQSVQHGPGASAGSILFERAPTRLTTSDTQLVTQLVYAGHGRRDASLNALTGNESLYARLQGSWAEADDYTDGSGNRVNSAYQRWNTQATLGWTPSENAALELSYGLSDAQAAYADRGMDGDAYDRETFTLRYQADQLNGTLRSIEAIAYHNVADHVMDNYSLREFTPSMMMSMPMVSNPERLTNGASVTAVFDRWQDLDALVGLDTQYNKHRTRNAMGMAVDSYSSLPYKDDAEFEQVGTFAEFNYHLGENNTLAFGTRLDRWTATDLRSTVQVGMGAHSMIANPTAKQKRSDTLASGYLRFERDLNQNGAKASIGIGRSERFPDYWELVSKEGATSISAFDTKPERLTQIDLGYLATYGDTTLTASLFYAEHDDFILIQSRYPKMMMGSSLSRMATVARNIEATTYGGEFEARYQNDKGWYLGGALAYTRGTNDTDYSALAQISPLELKLETGIRRQNWSAGWLSRLTSSQDRFALNQGNIAGQDVGPSEGFDVHSLHASYRVSENWSLAGGIDNLFDITYAEHITRNGTQIAGYLQTFRVNEPGRTTWLRLETEF